VLGAADVGAPHQRDRIWIVASDAAGDHGVTRRAEPERQQRTAGPSRRSPCVADATDADGVTDGEQHVDETPRYEYDGTNNVLADAAIKGLERQRIDARESTVSQSWDDGASVADADGDGTNGASGSETKRTWPSDEGWWTIEPDVGRVAHGVAHRVDRLRCTGNGQVPRVAALAWEVMR
jgi:DNA (cytosine-5)-methyltransferase 1